MGKKKKPFIDKKHSVRFHLVHRDQRDPLQADSDAPEMVLHHVSNEKELSKKEEQKKFGIYFDDEYDYLQHLKPRGEGVIVMAEEQPGPSSTSTAFKEVGGIKLPAEAFPSEFEEDKGMLERGVLPRGPQPNWDPDIVEALDDGLDLDNPDNILEDDFMTLANGEGEPSTLHGDDDDDDNYSDDAYSDRDFGSDDFCSDEGSYDKFGYEETKSRFTNYSMTSSVIRRTQGLQLIDDQFEKVMEEYDDDQIGGLDEKDDEEMEPTEKFLMDQAIEDLDVTHSKKNMETHQINVVASENVPEENEELEEFEKVVEPEKEKWDCESIISTYSNIYNHPKLITEPKPIKLTKRLGIPSDVLRKKNQTEKDASVETGNIKSASHYRSKDETKEEKKDRKAAVKEERRNRRVEKKANKLAFKDEQKIQERILASQSIKSTVPM